MANDTPVPRNRIERILLAVFASSLGLSIASILAVSIAGATRADMTGSIWLTVRVLPFIGLFFAAIFFVAFAVVFFLRRRRLAQGGR